ncbi:hypothetical protein DPMN_140935 [Dreissena polymorpha]|uniref:G-protein coupled receptors family 1 profile domain-containing protein n=1 Tax=Dreissena polymorpha TaxID=45954 RepID=A0A9D4G8I4_DREPO|nr:hypothetical protein DPMN_140935 [Dreissena polymorpha]
MDANNISDSNIANVSYQTMTTYASIISKELFDAYNIFLYAIITLGVPGNLLVLIVFIKHRPSNTTDWFIVFITTFDLLSSLLNVPVYVTFTNTLWQHYGTDVICKLHMYLSQSIVLSSSFSICGLALDRYIKVCRPNAAFLTKMRARNVCIGITVTTSLLSIPCLFIFANIKGRCNVVVMNSYLFSYYLMVFVVFCTATATVVVAYFQVSDALRRSEFNVKRHQSVNINQKHIDPERKSSDICLWLFFLKCCSKVAPSMTSYRKSNKIVPSRETIENNTMNASETQQRSQIIKVRSASSACTSIENQGDLMPPTSLRATVPAVSFVASANSGRTMNTLTGVIDSRQQGIRNASIRTTRIAFLVCAVFVISWLPPWISFFLATKPSFPANPTVVRFMLFGKMTYLLNTVVNPFIYTWFNRKFRQKLHGIFSSCKQ